MFLLPNLPYDYAALEPVISSATMKLHHDRHHAKYVETLNGLLNDEMPAELEAVMATAQTNDMVKVLQNAGQAWNHAFFWNAMSPTQTFPMGPLLDAIGSSFGDLASLRQSFVQAGVGHFGSGWVWLVATENRLTVTTTHDGKSLANGPGVPLLVCDLWEHAYYLDYQNNRAGFLEAWWDGLANWEFAEAQFFAARGERGRWTYDEGARAQPLSGPDEFLAALDEATRLLASPPETGSSDDRHLTTRLEQVSDFHGRRATAPSPEERARFEHLDARLKAFDRRWPRHPPPGLPDHWQPALGGDVAG